MIKERSFIIYLLLSIVTCGIYAIYFWYTYNEDLNKMTEEDGEPLENFILVLVLTIITFGIYKYIWLYRVGNKLVKNGYYAIAEDGTSLVLWTLFGSLLCGIGPFMAQYFMVNNFNTLTIRYNSKFVRR